MRLDPFHTLVFGGGGTRCFWHGGFMEAAEASLPLGDVRHVYGVSGGALSGAAWIAGREWELLETMAAVLGRNDANGGNVEAAALLEGERPFPHEALYREIVSSLLDTAALERIIEGPEFRIQLAQPSPLGPLATAAAYAVDRIARSSPHPQLPQKIGAEALLVDARAVAREGKLVELVVAAASSPPVFEQYHWDGHPVMDGGVVDNAPVGAAADPPVLLLVTRPYGDLPESDDRLYAMPSEQPPPFKLDFTAADEIHQAWRLGERDGRAFLRRYGID